MAGRAISAGQRSSLITAEELKRMKATSTDGVLADLQEHSPLLVTDSAR